MILFAAVLCSLILIFAIRVYWDILKAIEGGVVDEMSHDSRLRVLVLRMLLMLLVWVLWAAHITLAIYLWVLVL